MGPVFERGNIASLRGMTLVETMVAMAIASAMMLAILEIVQVSNRSAKNVTTVNDWSAQISSIQQAIANQEGCTDAITLANPGITFTQAGTDGVGNNPVGTVVAYNTLTHTPISVLATNGTAYNNNSYVINNNNVAAAPPATPPNHSMGISLFCPGTNCFTSTTKLTVAGVSTTFNMFNAQLVVNGTKQSAVGGGKQLGSQQLATPNGGLPVTLLVYAAGANVNQIYGCYGAHATEATICAGLGGVWQNDNSCVISSLQFFSDGNAGVLNNPSPPGAAGPYGSPQFSPSSPNAYDTMNGERIQLYGTPGTLSPTDAAIGIGGPGVPNQWTGSSDPYMWFNVGGGGQATFDFHSRTTTGYDHDHMELGDLSGNGQSFLVVDPLPYMSNEPNGTAAQFYLGGWYFNNSYGIWMEGPGFSYSGYGPDPTNGANGMMWWAQASIPWLGAQLFYLPRAAMDEYGTLNILPNWTLDWNGPPGTSVLAFSDLTSLPNGFASGEYVLSDRSVPDLELWAGGSQMFSIESSFAGNVTVTVNTSGLGGAFQVNGPAALEGSTQIFNGAEVNGGELVDDLGVSNALTVTGMPNSGGNVMFGTPNGYWAPFSNAIGGGGAPVGMGYANYISCPGGQIMINGGCECDPPGNLLIVKSEYVGSGQLCPYGVCMGPLWFCECRVYQAVPAGSTVTVNAAAICVQE